MLCCFLFESGRANNTIQLMTAVHKQHSKDPNFPMPIIEKIEEFLGMLKLFPVLSTIPFQPLGADKTPVAQLPRQRGSV